MRETLATTSALSPSLVVSNSIATYPDCDLIKQIRSHEVAIVELRNIFSSQAVYKKNGNIFFHTTVRKATTAAAFLKEFVALQPKIITYENSVASFTMAARFLTGPTAMATSFIAIGLRKGLCRIDIVQWTTQRARLYAASLIITYLVISSVAHSVSRGTLFRSSAR
ncbi:hypothetical protein F0562_002157 [Nyssa sinensis]|uniref:Uncharacterized protein n=1 Tax=Nyssa sinensis TaxID=561372 RepID=A0A5J5C4Z7_9ASTE|nr:hypothetical protein F0562_002157 [Nyssa sinensis]